MRGLAIALGALVAVGCASDPCEEGAAGIVCQLAGTGALGFNSDGLPANETDLYLPSEVRRAPDGRVWLMDFNNHRLRAIQADGTITTIAGNGFHAFATPGTPATDSPLENPIAFDFLPDGRALIASYHDPRLLTLEPDGTLKVLAGRVELGERGDEGDGGPALEAQWIQPTGLAVAGDGTIYISDSIASRVRRIEDGVVTTVAGTATVGYGGDGGPASAAYLNWPTALALDGRGNLLIADSKNHAIRQVTPEGIITTIAGGRRGSGGDGGPATEASLAEPDGIAVAADGTLYISDRSNFRIRRVRDGVITTVAGSGTRGLTGNGGPALEATFGFLSRLHLDPPRLLIADQSNSCVRSLVLPD